MTAAQIALQLLPLISVRSLEPPANTLNDVNLSTGDVDACAIAITQAIEEIFGLGPTAISEQRLSMTLMPPTNVSFTATQYSTTISAFSGWASWMIGCTIQGGDGEDNELLSATELLRPYQAGSGTANCTVYGDAIKLPSYVKNTMDPVETPLIPRLMAVTNRDDFRCYNGYDVVTPRTRGGFYGPWYNTRQKTAGQPSVYFVESRYDPTTGELPLFLRVNPMPGGATPITIRVKRKPPIVVADDITADATAGLTVTGTMTPDALGFYTQVGDNPNGTSLYVRLTGDPLTISTNTAGTQWFLQTIVADPFYDWTGPVSDSPDGVYVADSGTTGSCTVTSNYTTDLVIPTDWHQSILLPIAKKWFMSHPAFNNPSAVANIMEGSRIAKQTLESFIPQITPTQGHYH